MNSSFSVKPSEKTDVVTGFDPLSLLVAETEQHKEEEEDEDDNKSISTPSARRDLAEEIVMYMNNMSSPLTSRTPSIDLQRACDDKSTSKKSPTLVKACRRSSLPPNSPRPVRLTKSKSYTKSEERPRDRLWSSPAFSPTCPFREESQNTLTHTSPSFNLDTLLVPKLDVLRHSMFTAGKGVAEKASKWYSRFTMYTTSSKVSFVGICYFQSHIPTTKNENLLVMQMCFNHSLYIQLYRKDSWDVKFSLGVRI